MECQQVVVLCFLLQLSFFGYFCKSFIDDKEATLSPDSVEKWISNSDLSLVFYSNKEIEGSFDPAPVFTRLQQTRDKLAKHSISYGWYDCTDNEAQAERCKNIRLSDPSFSVFLRGQYLMELPVDSLFDESAIMSNTLQLLLIQEVPLIQDADDLLRNMKEAKQKRTQDFLLMFVPGIGTTAHAEYMEVASEAQDDDSIKVNFAHSTRSDIITPFRLFSATEALSREVMGESVHTIESQLYYFECSVVEFATEEMKCPVYRYMGVMEAESIRQFITMMSGGDNVQRVTAINKKLPSVTCCTEAEKGSEAENVIDVLSEEMRGSVLFYTMSKSKCEFAGISAETDSVTCHIRDEEYSVSESLALDYVRKNIITKVLMTRAPSADGADMNSEAVPSDDEDLSELDKLIIAVETIDDSVQAAEDEYGGRPTAIFPNLVKLDRDTFNYDEYTGVVIFHIVKYDARNRVVLRIFNEAAKQMPDQKLAMLNCYDWTDVCRKIDVHAFPTIRTYKQGKHLDYKGPRSVDGFKRLAMLAPYYAPHKMESMSDMMEIRKTCVDSKLDILIGLYKDDDSKDYKTYKKAAQELVGQKVMTVATGDFARQIQKQFSLPSLPVILSYNPSEHGDPSKAIKLYDRQMFLSGIIQFALKSTLPSLVELTPNTLPVLFKTKRPQLLLFIDDLTSDLYKAVDELSADKSVMNKFGFSYLTMHDKPVNQKIFLSLSDGSQPPPAILVADYKKGNIYQNAAVSDAKNVNTENIKKWLQEISLGNITPTKSVPVGEWKPAHPGYDFLDMIEKDKLKAKKEHDRLNILPKIEAMKKDEADTEPTTTEQKKEMATEEPTTTPPTPIEHQEL